MKPDLLDAATAMRLLEEVVADKGEDYVYEPHPFTYACQYLHDDEPGCLVGHVLHRHGVPIEVIRQWEGRTAQYLATGKSLLTLSSARPELEPLADHPAASILIAAQQAQDVSLPWGKALQAARARFEAISTHLEPADKIGN